MQNKPHFNPKLPNVGTSIFALMSKMANDFKAINLSQGFPDFDTSKELTALVAQAMEMGFNQYAPMPGLPILTEAISEKTKKTYGFAPNPQKEITITAGATQGLFTAISAFVEASDEVILFDPAYDSYQPAVELCKGKAIRIPLLYPDFSIDWERVKSAISEKTKLIVLNFPQNPTGAILKESDVLELIKFTEGTDIIILSDEVYEHIVFDGAEHLSLLKYEALRNRTLVINSFGKTYHTTGWKMGYCIANETLSNAFRKIHQFNVFSVNTPMQWAYAQILQNPESYLSIPNFYEKKRNLLIDLLKNSKFKIVPTKSTYFQLLDYSNISNQNDMDFTAWMCQEKGVAAIPLTPFYENGNDKPLIRLCFAKKDETLKMACEKLCEI